MTKYVSTTGNNANDGSINAPWKTVAHACAQVQTPGDIIRVNSGTFTETAPLNLAVGVTLEGGSTTSVIKAGYPANHLLMLASSSEGTNGNQEVRNLKFDGNNRMGLKAIWVKGRSNVKIHDCTILDFEQDGVAFSGKANGLVGPPTVFATGNEFYANVISNCSAYSGYGHGCLNIAGQSGLIVRNNIITQIGRPLGTNGYCIKFYEEGYSKGVMICGNVITKAPFDGTTFDFAIEQWNILGGWEVFDNVITGAFDMAGVSKGSSTYSIDFHHNIVGPTSQPAVIERGIELEARPEGTIHGCADVIIRDNTFRNLHTPISIQNNNEGGKETYSNIKVYNNVFDGVGKSTTGGGGGSVFYINATDASGVYNGLYFWNNVFYGRYPQAFDGLQIDGIGTMTNVQIKNNIFVGFSRAPIFSWSSKGGTITALSIQNNLYYLNGTNAWVNNGITPMGLTNTGNITGNPLFLSATDFHLQATSPGINAGINVGLPYNGTAPDIGAFEFIPEKSVTIQLTVTDSAGATGTGIVKIILK